MVPTNTPFTLALASPYNLIQDIFSRSKETSEDLPRSISQEFRKAFPDNEARAKVPWLTRRNLQDLKGKTVRWKGMVQDNSMGNEIVLATLPSSSSSSASQPKCALYGADSITSEVGGDVGDDNSSSYAGQELTERAVIYAASLPGRSTWAKEADSRSLPLEEATQSHRLDDTEGQKSSDGSTLSWGVKTKIPRSEENDALGVLLKVYDIPSAESLQAGDVVEVVGILNFGPLPSSEWATGDASTTDDAQTTISEDLHPTLHVLFHDKLADVWSSVDATHLGSTSAPTAATVVDAEESRASLIHKLASALNGDQEAAEWLLLALIASIHTRKAPFALGHLSLRLHLPSSASSSDLSSLLSTLVPSIVPLPLTLTNLNDASISYSPTSQPDATGLRAGSLQLPRGTTLLIEECISEGKLASHGLLNLEALQEIISRCELGYRFPFNPMPFFLPVDMGVVILCKEEEDEEEKKEKDHQGGVQGDTKSVTGGGGGGGLIKCDVDVLVSSSPSSSESDINGTTDLQALRNHLLKSRRLARTLQIPAQVAEEIQRDFVTLRSSSSSSSSSSKSTSIAPSTTSTAAITSGTSQEDLLRRMDLARLISASKGKTMLTFEDFLRAKEMDQSRLDSLATRRKVGARGGAGAGSTRSD